MVSIYQYVCHICYSKTGGPKAHQSMLFSLLSTTIADPPVFTLTFNVTDSPPTNISCTVNEKNFNKMISRTIVDASLSITAVMVTVRIRQGGIYKCVVSNSRSNASSINSSSMLSIVG